MEPAKYCSGCVFYFRPATQCRANPPQATVVGLTEQGPQIVSFWPNSKPTDYCGTHMSFEEAEMLEDDFGHLPGPQAREERKPATIRHLSLVKREDEPNPAS